MAPQYRFFRIPCFTDSPEEVELNTFLRSVKILCVHHNFVADGGGAYAFLSVEYMDGSTPKNDGRNKKSKVDYREVLPAEDFMLFSSLREWRKAQGIKEAVALFAIFTNEQLAQIASKRPDSKTAMQEIAGIGDAKISKYADAVLGLIAQTNQTKK